MADDDSTLAQELKAITHNQLNGFKQHFERDPKVSSAFGDALNPRGHTHRDDVCKFGQLVLDVYNTNSPYSPRSKENMAYILNHLIKIVDSKAKNKQVVRSALLHQLKNG